MPTRRFDGVDDEIRCAIGSCDRNAGGTTFGILCKKNVNAVWQALIGLHNTLGTAVQAIEISNANALYWDLDVTGQSVDGQVTVADGWVMLFFGKAAGATATARASKLIMSSGVWTHSNAGGTMTDGVMPGASGTVRFGEWEDGDDFNGWLGCAGVWASNLSDAAREALAPSLQAWKNSSPVGLWAFNQDSVATAVTDLTGNGANQSAITGTSVDAAEVPPNFSFALGITQAIGQALETDSSAVLTAAKARALVGTVEPDTAAVFSATKTAALAESLEQDDAATLNAAKTQEIGQVQETDAATSLASVKTGTIDQSIETDSAAVLDVGKTMAVGLATSTDAAGEVTASKMAAIAGTTETDAAAALTAEKAQQISSATETDLAQAFLVPGGGAISPAVEVDQALAFGAEKTQPIDVATESDLAQPLGTPSGQSIGAASELDFAQSFSAEKVLAIGTAFEVDFAQPFFIGEAYMIPDPMEALRRFLLTDVDVMALSGGRVYAGELPRSEASTSARTCLVLRPALGFGRDWAYMHLNDPQFDMRSYGSTVPESYELHLAAHSALKQMGRNVKEGCLLHWAKPLATPMSDRDPETEWPFTLSTWQALVSEMEVI